MKRSVDRLKQKQDDFYLTITSHWDNGEKQMQHCNTDKMFQNMY